MNSSTVGIIFDQYYSLVLTCDLDKYFFMKENLKYLNTFEDHCE